MLLRIYKENGMWMGYEFWNRPLKFGKNQEDVFLGREISQQKNYSEDKSIQLIMKLVK